MLQDCQEAQSKQEQYRASTTRAPRALIQDFSEEAHLCYQAKRMGLPISETTIIVNEWRMNNNKDLLSWSAVQSFISGSSVMVPRKRGVKKSGKSDKSSDWAKARVVQCVQWRHQLRLGDRPLQIAEVAAVAAAAAASAGAARGGGAAAAARGGGAAATTTTESADSGAVAAAAETPVALEAATEYAVSLLTSEEGWGSMGLELVAEGTATSTVVGPFRSEEE